ncbi:hypothetical protein [Endozoicomonas sp. OPT23]|uniref:hypothetical protein n=1 Tax=Endozoicomonas sp. OPT23 TaxID=2072845 RepID=UPI00129A82CC|nr:hypothetical protein [Endozoicomonas sp. OPT23]
MKFKVIKLKSVSLATAATLGVDGKAENHSGYENTDNKDSGNAIVGRLQYVF